MNPDDVVFKRRVEEDRTKLTDAAYGEIKAAILDLRLSPGDMLREATIADQLGISKTPVREALLTLKEDGLVKLVPYRGAMVTGYTADDVHEIFEIRAILEAECARRAAEKGDPELIARMRANVEAARSEASQGNLPEVIALFDEFDATLFSLLRSKRLKHLVENLQLHMKRIGKLTTEIPGRVETSLEQHEAIVDALASRDPELAQAVTRAHIASVLQDELEHMAAQSESDRAAVAGASVSDG